MEGKFYQTKLGLGLTILLGVYFTILQGWEYYEARFSFADRVFGLTFFIATGFHGLHVIVGTLFLRVCYI
jgi:cytochrome c oxidase subunit 3